MLFAARYEHKYLITPEQESIILDFVTAFCRPDRFGVDGAYNVYSLYFDTWDWLTAAQALEGLRNRFKLRMRTYEPDPESPIWVEDKGRVGLSIVKQRARVTRRHARAVARSDAPPSAGLSDDAAPIYGQFRDRVDQLAMQPRLWVRYERHAFGSVFGDNARLTFDRHLAIQAPHPDHPLQLDDSAWQHVPLERPTILELKFNGGYPQWMERLVRALGLERLSVSKYVRGAVSLGDVPWNRPRPGAAWMVS